MISGKLANFGLFGAIFHFFHQTHVTLLEPLGVLWGFKLANSRPCGVKD